MLASSSAAAASVADKGTWEPVRVTYLDGGGAGLPEMPSSVPSRRPGRRRFRAAVGDPDTASSGGGPTGT